MTQEDSTTIAREAELTHREKVPKGLQHHITIQSPLGRVQLPPVGAPVSYTHLPLPTT